MKYLGLLIESFKKFRCSGAKTVGKFYGALNGIMRFRVKPSQDVLLKLLMSHCAPILTYGIEVFEFSTAETQQRRMAYNTIFRKIYGYRRNESVADACCLKVFRDGRTWFSLDVRIFSGKSVAHLILWSLLLQTVR